MDSHITAKDWSKFDGNDNQNTLYYVSKKKKKDSGHQLKTVK